MGCGASSSAGPGGSSPDAIKTRIAIPEGGFENDGPHLLSPIREERSKEILEYRRAAGELSTDEEHDHNLLSVNSSAQRRRRATLETSSGVDEASSSAEGEADEDGLGDLPAIEKRARGRAGSMANRRRRFSVSAEAMSASDQAKARNAERVVHAKTDDDREWLTATIRDLILFRHLDDEGRGEIVDAFFEKTVEEDEELITQGDVGDFFYVVANGEFDIFVDFKDGAPRRKVLTSGVGKSFGELALMYMQPRAATCVATMDSRVWALDRLTFTRTMMAMATDRRTRNVSYLKNIPLLENLTANEMARIADSMKEEVYDEDHTIFRQGDEGDTFYILATGTASVVRTEGNGPELELTRLVAGDYFGEVALLKRQERLASVVTLERCKCLLLDEGSFTRVIGPVQDTLTRKIDDYETYEEILERTTTT